MKDRIFYHIYPLGYCGAEMGNDASRPVKERLYKITDRLPHLSELGFNALYIGPLFESVTHGYDTTDYFKVDRRLGSKESLQFLCHRAHELGFKVIFDGVFNHCGREFFAFKQLKQQGQASDYRHWFCGVDFHRNNPMNDGFDYATWEGHYNLVKFNLEHPDVRKHLFSAVDSWIDDYGLDGLRLDAADCLSTSFIQSLASHCRQKKDCFWMVGEMIHGDYRRIAGPGLLNGVTNYEAYKGLWSSLNDSNYFEIAYALKRQSSAQGIYRDLDLYNFTDNHDVDRVASRLTKAEYLYPLNVLLYSMPGIPSLYYGSEYGLAGARTDYSDAALRPSVEALTKPHPDLGKALAKLAGVRNGLKALVYGDYSERLVKAQQFIFERKWEGQRVLVCVNSSRLPETISLAHEQGLWRDALNDNQVFGCEGGQLRLQIPPCWGRILIQERQ